MIYSLLFFLSGLAGLLYQIVWLRMAFGHFGILTPVLSVVVSVFMLGLGAGAQLGGRWAPRRAEAPGGFWLRSYGAIELAIGLWACGVPYFFRLGEMVLLRGGQMSSAGYLAGSAVAITLAILPACLLMGMTFPVMMAHARRQWTESRTSFSFLYRANVLGALAGSILTPVLFIELLGFHATLGLGVAANLVNAAVSFSLSRRFRPAAISRSSTREAEIFSGHAKNSSALLYPLFITGFVSMAFEVMWTRSLTPALGTTIYAFAAVLAVYLAATWAGTALYRRDLMRGKLTPLPVLYRALAFSAFLPVLIGDPRLHFVGLMVLASLFPFCGILGYTTPYLVDIFSQGNARAAGRAYAVNIAGCVLGPLVACYAVLPYAGTVWGILGMTALLFLLQVPSAAAGLVLILVGTRFGLSPEDYDAADPAGVQILRDYAGTVVSAGQGFDRRLLVNGIGLTVLNPLTKAMAHLPVYCHRGRPESALLICFGMGTTYRSLLSWGLKTTAVELVPSVPDAFGYYFDDAADVIKNPLGTIVIDDGRRFLQRTTDTFDIVTLDPPPPVEAAGSGLLYSKEFYDLVKRRLKPDGILQQWWPGGEKKILLAAARSIAESFPHVRVYRGVGGNGFHFLASRQEMGRPTVEECIRRMPPGARQDLLEWNPGWALPPLVRPFFDQEIPIERLLDPSYPAAITDDHPVNEYYLLRRARDRWKGRFAVVR